MGINVLYLGMVGGVVEGVLFGVFSFVVLFEFYKLLDYDCVVELCVFII